MAKKFKEMSLGQRIFRIAAGFEIAVVCLSAVHWQPLKQALALPWLQAMNL